MLAIILAVASACGGVEPSVDAPVPVQKTSNEPAAVPVLHLWNDGLPEDPTPAVAGKAAEVPSMEAELAAMEAYTKAWKDEKDRTLMLSGVSQLLVVGGFQGNVMFSLREKPEIRDTAIKLHAIHARIGRYPDDFTENLRAHLKEVFSQPHHGVWKRAKTGGETPHDYAALAAWVMHSRPEYFRELLAARTEGFDTWKDLSPSASAPRYLAQEVPALKRLALLSPLTSDERTRLLVLEPSATIEPGRATAPTDTGPLKLGPKGAALVEKIAKRYAVDAQVVVKQALTSAKLCLSNDDDRAEPNRASRLFMQSLVFVESSSRGARASEAGPLDDAFVMYVATGCPGA